MKQLSGKYFKRILVVLITFQIVFAATAGVNMGWIATADSGTGSDGSNKYMADVTYTFGDGTKNTFETQGKQGFYAMYSSSVNQATTAFPVETAKECVLDTDNYWKIPKESGGYVDKFRIASGRISGALAQGVELATGYTSIIKWVAPMSGEFSVSAKWRGAGDGILSANNDGINLGIYKNSENIYNNQIEQIKGYAAGPSWNNDGSKLTLEKGDVLYFVSDPKEIGYKDRWTKDTPWVQIIINGTITLKEDKELPESDITEAPKPGTVYSWGDWTKNTFDSQGKQGFYAMYSTAVNQGNSFPLDEIYLLQRDTDKASPYYKVPLSDGNVINNYFSIGAGVDYDGKPTEEQSAVNLDKGYSGVIRWVAPADGDYALNIKWKAHGKTGIFTANNDGLELSVYHENQNLFYHDQIEKIAGWGACPAFNNGGNAISMKKGESIYIIADPKERGYENTWTFDSPWLDIQVEYTESLKENNILPPSDISGKPTSGTVFSWGDWAKNPFTKQGQQGFYAMYSTAVDQGNTFPTETAYLLERDTDENSPYYKIPYKYGGFVNGFLMGAGVDYNNNPTDHQAAVDLKSGFSAVLRWVAPADGDYLINAKWVYSTTGVYTNSDGIIVGVYREKENLFNHEQINKITQWGKETTDTIPYWNNDGKTVTLHKGESIYIIGDPKKDGTNDRPWVTVDIEYRSEIVEDKNLPAADTGSKPEVGTTYYWGDWTKNTFVKQGQQGFYAMFSTVVNKGDSFPLDSASLLKRNPDPASPYWMVPLKNGGFDSGFLIGAGTDYNGNPTDRQTAINLKNGYTGILRWVAPADGYYHVRAAWRCHDTAGTFSSTKDGLFLSVYKDNERVYSKDVVGILKGWDVAYPKWNNDGDTVHMKKGQSLYFVNDPKNDAANDTPWMLINISYEGDKMIHAVKQRDENDFSWTPEKEPEIGTEFYWGDSSKNMFTYEGQQGFFAMYGTAVAQKAKYPVNILKKCTFDDFTNFWTIPESSEDYTMRLKIGSGRSDTNPAVFPTTNRTAAIKWVAPVDGTYTVKYVNFGNWNAKPKFSLSGSDDGVTVGVYRDNGENLYTKTYNKNEVIVYNDVVYNDPSWFTTTLTLKKGEAVYFVGDPNNDATGDSPWCHIKVILKNMKVDSFDASEKDWKPEVRDEYYWGDEVFNPMVEQGSQNFYNMYLGSSNYTNDFPTFALKRMGVFSIDPRQWMTGNSSIKWMYMRATGTHALQQDKSFGVKWLAPEDGTYYVDAMIFQGTKQGYKETSGEDGIAYGIYKGTQNLVYVDKGPTSWTTAAQAMNDPEQHMKTEVSMKKGEALFFTADSKKVVAGSDLPGLRIKISTNNEEIDYTTGMKPFETPKSTETPDVVSPKNNTWIIVLVAVSAVVLAAGGGIWLVIAKKKKAK